MTDSTNKTQATPLDKSLELPPIKHEQSYLYARAQEAIASGEYSKNLSYTLGRFGNDAFAVVKAFGMPAVVAWIGVRLYNDIGQQVQVSHEVSQDMEMSDFSGTNLSFKNIPWPSECLEFYFHDPMLPSVLMTKIDKVRLDKHFNSKMQYEGPYIDATDETFVFVTMQQKDTPTNLHCHLSLNMPLHLMDWFITSGATWDMDQTPMFSSGLTDTDQAIMWYMCNLCLKCLAFASTPVCNKTPMHRKDMHCGGKAGVKDRPQRPASLLKYAYLPKVTHPKLIEKYERMLSQQSQHEFHGRIGVIRWYMHDRYVNRKGTWSFLPPIPDPKTGKVPNRVIRVRKPHFKTTPRTTQQAQQAQQTQQ